MENAEILIIENGHQSIKKLPETKEVSGYEIIFPETESLEMRRRWAVREVATGKTSEWTLLADFISIGEIHLTVILDGYQHQYQLARMNLDILLSRLRRQNREKLAS